MKTERSAVRDEELDDWDDLEVGDESDIQSTTVDESGEDDGNEVEVQRVNPRKRTRVVSDDEDFKSEGEVETQLASSSPSPPVPLRKRRKIQMDHRESRLPSIDPVSNQSIELEMAEASASITTPGLNSMNGSVVSQCCSRASADIDYAAGPSQITTATASTSTPEPRPAGLINDKDLTYSPDMSLMGLQYSIYSGNDSVDF